MSNKGILNFVWAELVIDCFQCNCTADLRQVDMARHRPGINLKVPSLTDELIAQLDVLLMDGPECKPEFVLCAFGPNVENLAKTSISVHEARYVPSFAVFKSFR